MKKGEGQASGEAASRLIDQRILDLGDWRGEALARMRKLILEAVPEMTEEWKWGTPVWSCNGIVTTGEAYTKVAKLTFIKGARVPDPTGIFNSSLEGNARRAIDIREGEKVDASAFKALVKAAAALNSAPKKKATPVAKKAVAAKKAPAARKQSAVKKAAKPSGAKAKKR
ncbi:DUF1801 domain-containing protein [Myxococcus faecalis]|uniref:DUF1801 domain-containing protein n=1 Tax=Myxococcus TaxID=32 RepID=UPI001D5AC258|nr:DUF1801 domain-containing protein [Myxococcus sp. XM-1-1-1]